MTNKQIKATLDAVGGLLFLASISENATPEIKNLVNSYCIAIEKAKEALDIMDRDIKIEKRGDK